MLGIFYLLRLLSKKIYSVSIKYVFYVFLSVDANTIVKEFRLYVMGSENFRKSYQPRLNRNTVINLFCNRQKLDQLEASIKDLKEKKQEQ